MRQVLKTYDLVLKVKGPVFIGNGLEIQKKEYLFLDKTRIGIVDAAKLYQLAKKKRITDDLERFMVMDTKEDLKHWTMRNHITLKEIEDCMKYEEKVGDRQEEKGKLQLMCCTADPYGNPYIPGSSVKGMLRTILLGSALLQRKGEYARNARQMQLNMQEPKIRRQTFLNKSVRDMENRTFHTLNRPDTRVEDAVNDYMSGVIVSDSEPISREQVILCQKWERHLDGSEKAINILRECIKPGTLIRCKLTIDASVCPLTVADIRESVGLFYQQYYGVFQKKFPGTDRGSCNTVLLGGGSGFVSKTIIYDLFEQPDAVKVTRDIFEKTMSNKVFREHKHFTDTKVGVSPHILKCTRYQGKSYMMGQCELTISE